MLEFAGLEIDILTIIVLLPLFGAAAVALLTQDNPILGRGIALATSLVVLALAIFVFVNTNRENLGPNEYAYENRIAWFDLLGSSWHVGVDGISAPMILLTAILTPIALIIAFEHTERPHIALALFLFMETGMLGVFVALDMLIFFLFYEIGLVPMYFIIYLWGGSNRDYASRKFFIYTMAGSLGLLLSIQLIALGVGAETGSGITFDIPTWLATWPGMSLEPTILGLSSAAVKWFTLIGFALAFALKIPVFPLHTWLPDAHTEAPTAGSMLLAGVLLKLGAYGFLRLVIPLFPLEWIEVRTPSLAGLEIPFVEYQAVQILALLATLSIVFGAFSAWAQDDFKKLVAYSSVNHMGFVALGLAVFASVYGASYAMSLSGTDAAARGESSPQWILHSLDDKVTQDDVTKYLGRGNLDEVIANDNAYAAVALLKLVDKYDYPGSEIEWSCPSGIISSQDAASCSITHFSLIEDSRQAATVATNGAVMQMFNHGLSAAGMFLLVGALYHKAHTRDLRRFGGLWHTIPIYGAALVFTSMASLGLPGLNGFIGEYLVIAGAFPVKGFSVYVLICMIGLLITGAYILKGLQKVLHGPVNPEWDHYHKHHHSLEIERRELLALVPLMVLMLITGLYPNWVLSVINETVGAMFLALGV